MNRQYRFDTEITDVVFAETSRSSFQAVVRLHTQRQRDELEQRILEDWDEAHRDPMKDFASALNTSLADKKRRERREQDKAGRDV